MTLYGSPGVQQFFLLDLWFRGLFFSAFEKSERKRDNLKNKSSFLQLETKKRLFWANACSRNFKIVDFETDLSQTTSKTKSKSFCAKIKHICLGANFDDFASCGRILLTIQLHLRTTESDINCIATDVFRSFALIIKADMLTTDSTSMIYFLFVTQCFHYLRSLHPFRKMRANVHRFMMQKRFWMRTRAWAHAVFEKVCVF